ncbi:radical SAM protein [Oceanidesulfovibrio indonesiensis]|uniref:Radical SAM protein n=1 Tax=Oceanidesulfovibrio indonesiensis TaxID=54767 RepID=A0A7M3MID2_9BACT|nr:radical SAM protein [Oceanidesulfovibrio indonesiensis]TVM19217.1 radical SAM protein [Oceanidesulfovibrio indonesiensis]
MSKKRVLLIYPRGGANKTADAIFPFPLQGLTQLAASMPERFETVVHDENLRPLNGSAQADLVMLTAMTTLVSRAYEIADDFRSRGVPVIMGGAHATACPDEVAHHADSVVIGEAENLLPQILADFEAGQLAPRYTSDSPADLNAIPFPAMEALSWRHRFFMASIQTSRGCPLACDFCSVPATFGRKLRVKSIETLDEELKGIRAKGMKRVFVVDDNFTADRARAIEIFGLLKKYGMTWMGFSNLAIADEPEFLEALRKSGCTSLFIGFESLNDQALYHKNRRYPSRAALADAVDRIRSYGIGIQGSFIFGFDEDTPEVFSDVVSFVMETGIEIPNLNILTPLPGTPLYREMKEQGRLLDMPWDDYDMSHVVYRPAGMEPEELQQGFAWALKYLASPSVIFKRLSLRRRQYPFFLMANFALHRAQTRLANTMWNAPVQRSLEARGFCTP